MQTEFPLYIDSLEYAEDSLTVTVRLTLKENGRKLEGISAHREYSLTDKNAWWKTVFSAYVLDGVAIYGVVDSALTQDEINRDGKSYSHLKIVFDYATIYKSTESNGSVTEKGKNRIHSLSVAESGNTVLEMKRDTPNTATWYCTLICAGILLAVVALGITQSARGNYGRKRKENRQEEP